MDISGSDFTAEKTYEKTRLPVEEATTLPPDAYRSQTFFSQEREQVLAKAWVCIGYTSQVDQPGKTLTATVAGQPIFVSRDKSQTLHGFYNVCRHRGSILVTKDGKNERFRCPYHAWTYDLEGKLLHCPLFGKAGSFAQGDYGLLPVRVESWGCFLFVTLDPNAIPLEEYLGDMVPAYKNFPLGDLVLVRRKTYDIHANWKLIGENFLEYYHLPWVHPELCAVTAIDNHKRNQGAGMYMSFFASPLLPGGTPLDAGFLPAMPGLPEPEATSGYFPLVFPNVAMFLMPHHLFSLIMNPQSAGHTQEYGDLLVHPSLLTEPDAEKKIDEIFAFYDMVNLQDILAVERVQQGIQVQAYQGGRMCHRFEEPVHRFQNMVIDYMVGKPTVPAGDSAEPSPEIASPAPVSHPPEYLRPATPTDGAAFTD